MFEAVLDDVIERLGYTPEGIHGVEHWRSVAEIGKLLAGVTPGADTDVVETFAAVHDACRESDGSDSGHGARAATLADRLYEAGRLELTDAQMDLLRFACTHHDQGETASDPTVGVCWDADRLDLPRVGIHPIARYMSTQAGRDAVEMLGLVAVIGAFEEWWPTLTDEQRVAVVDYAKGFAFPVNLLLRGYEDAFSFLADHPSDEVELYGAPLHMHRQEAERLVPLIDAALEIACVPVPLTAYRFHHHHPVELSGEPKPGQVFTSPTFVSVSLGATFFTAASTLAELGESELPRTFWQIDIPAGTRAAYLDPVNPCAARMGAYEDYVLIHRTHSYRLTRVERVANDLFLTAEVVTEGTVGGEDRGARPHCIELAAPAGSGPEMIQKAASG